MPYSKLFRSRWAALFWAAGILWTAADVAGWAPHRSGAANVAAPEDIAGDPIDNASIEAVAAAMNLQ